MGLGLDSRLYLRRTLDFHAMAQILSWQKVARNITKFYRDCEEMIFVKNDAPT